MSTAKQWESQGDNVADKGYRISAALLPVMMQPFDNGGHAPESPCGISSGVATCLNMKVTEKANPPFRRAARKVGFPISHTVASCVGLTSFVFVLQGQYNIDWFQITGGGGLAEGGGYSLNGAVNLSSNSAEMFAGNYSIMPSFSVPFDIVQTSVPPALTILLTETNTVVISWPLIASDFKVQVSTNVESMDWHPPLQPILEDSFRRTIIVRPSTGASFYRLVRP